MACGCFHYDPSELTVPDGPRVGCCAWCRERDALAVKLAEAVHRLPEEYGAGLKTCPGCNAQLWQSSGHREGCWFEDVLRLVREFREKAEVR